MGSALTARVLNTCARTMEIEIAQEVEVRTQRRKRAVPQTAATQSKKNKPTAAKGSKNKGNTTTDTKSTGSRKRKPRTTKPLTKAQRDQVATINVDDVYAYVNNRVPGELITDLFPDRLKLWEFLTGDMAKLNSLIDFAVTQYLALYHECSKERSKCSELFLRWLDFVRSVTCVSEHTPETIAILKILDNSGAGLETTMTVLAVIMNAVYMGVQKQMSKTVEELSNVSAGIPEGKPSDETSLHRICGWALKSTIDYTSKQSKQRQADNELDQKQQLLQALKLPQNEKSSLPAAVQYLDRGGMTFMQLPFTKWMRSTDEKITTLLNQRSYTVYGEKIFEVCIMLVCHAQCIYISHLHRPPTPAWNSTQPY